jgi:hypothetical protein
MHGERDATLERSPATAPAAPISPEVLGNIVFPSSPSSLLCSYFCTFIEYKRMELNRFLPVLIDLWLIAQLHSS